MVQPDLVDQPESVSDRGLEIPQSLRSVHGVDVLLDVQTLNLKKKQGFFWQKRIFQTKSHSLRQLVLILVDLLDGIPQPQDLLVLRESLAAQRVLEADQPRIEVGLEGRGPVEELVALAVAAGDGVTQGVSDGFQGQLEFVDLVLRVFELLSGRVFQLPDGRVEDSPHR